MDKEIFFKGLKNKVRVNPAAVGYLAKMFAMDQGEVCRRVEDINGDPASPEDLFGSQVRLDRLICLEKVFGKGLGFFTLQRPLEADRKASILFRKKRFSCDLGYADRLLISKIEDQALILSAYCTLMDKSLTRKLKRRRKTESAQEVAYGVRDEIGIRAEPYNSARRQLEYLIEALADSNIVVYEHLEKKGEDEKLNLAGFFLSPYTILIKRENQLSREIFTLAHELGHYLLAAEDIDEIDFEEEASVEERWCNEFAFHFILGKEGVEELAQIADRGGDELFSRFVEFSCKRHVSLSAIHYHFSKKRGKYRSICKEIKRGMEEERNRKGSRARRMGAGRASSEQIYSPLDKEIYLAALNAGIVEEHELVDKFKTRWIDTVVDW